MAWASKACSRGFKARLHSRMLHTPVMAAVGLNQAHVHVHVPGMAP